MGQETQAFLPFLVLIGLAAYVLFRGSRQRRELQTLQDRLVPGMEVMTSAGMYGTVTAVDAQEVTLMTAPGQTSRWDRRAVVRIISDPAAGTDASSTPNE